MPIWVQDNFFNTIRYFDKFIGLQAHEAVYLFFRKWRGPWISGAPSGYALNPVYQRYEFTLWNPPVPLTGGRPRLMSLKMYLDGSEMAHVASYKLTASDLDFWTEIDRGGPKEPDVYGRVFVGFHEGLDPSTHVVDYEYEQICSCMDVGEESFQPDSRCTICYGTGYVDGYDQYKAPALHECGRMLKPDNTILCRFPITAERMKISRYGGEIVTDRRSWTTASPILHDWDMIIRMRYYGNPIDIDPETGNIQDERYWITDWEHSSARPSYDLPTPAQPSFAAISRGITLHQKFGTAEVQPNHIAYQIPIDTVY